VLKADHVMRQQALLLAVDVDLEGRDTPRTGQ
jgi:hypothetical protein